jgi:surface protein
MCRDKHDNIKHKIIDYDEINYKCGKHNNKFISYCEICRENLCMLCEIDHDKKYQKKHNTLYYKELLANIEDINTEILKLKSKIDKIKKNIDDMIKMLNEVKVNIDIFSDINLTILKNYDENNINYQIIQNINAIQNNNIIDDINEIYNDKNINNKLIYISNIYSKIKELNEIIIRYKINENGEKIKLFDNEFIKKNEENCKIIINKREYRLIENFEVKKRKKDEDVLELVLKGINKIKDMSSMFYGCTSLVSLPNISGWNTIRVKDMSKVFRGCSSLS